MSRQVHCLVQNAHHLDDAGLCRSVDDEVTPTLPATRDVQRAQARENVIADPAAGHVGPIAERDERAKQRVAIDARLVRAKLLGRPPQDRGKVALRGRAQTDTPATRRRGPDDGAP